MSDSDHHHEHGPNCGHGHEHAHTPPKGGSKTLVWAVATAVVVGVGAYLISKLGEKSAKVSEAPNTDSGWQARINDEKTSDKSR